MENRIVTAVCDSFKYLCNGTSVAFLWNWKIFYSMIQNFTVFGIPDFLSEPVHILEDYKIFVINTQFM